METTVAIEPPWGGGWPAAGQAIDVPTPAPGPHWRLLRGWLEQLGFDIEPNLHPEHGLVGYSMRVRNAMVGIGTVQRPHGLHLAITAVLCRGMDREQLALLALDNANAALRIGQLLYYPGPPAELAFYASTPFSLLNEQVFHAYLQAIFREVEETCFAAVALVRGFHPADMAQFWDELESIVQSAMDQQPGGDASAEPPADAAPAPADVGPAQGDVGPAQGDVGPAQGDVAPPDAADAAADVAPKTKKTKRKPKP